MAGYIPNSSKGDDAQADLHKARTINKPSTLHDPIYAKKEAGLRNKILHWKNIFYAVLLIIVLLPFIAAYLPFFLRIVFAK